jgi:hypothetical protein
LNLTNLERLEIEYSEGMDITEAIAIRDEVIPYEGVPYEGTHTPITEYFPHFTKLDHDDKETIVYTNNRIREYRRHKLHNIARTIELMQSHIHARKSRRKKYIKKRMRSAPTRMYTSVKPKAEIPAKIITSNSAPTQRRRSKKSSAKKSKDRVSRDVNLRIPLSLNADIASFLVPGMKR